MKTDKHIKNGPSGFEVGEKQRDQKKKTLTKRRAMMKEGQHSGQETHTGDNKKSAVRGVKDRRDTRLEETTFIRSTLRNAGSI